MNDEARKILITGFMGAGKTTIAVALARALDCAAIDLDQFINEREKRSSQQIIDAEGEMRFRETETRALATLLKTDAASSARIISLGGGTWTIGRNRALIAQHNGFVVWLDAPFEICWRRIAHTGKSRPFARDREKARARYAERRPLYQLAALRIAITESQRPNQIADQIAAVIGQLETPQPDSHSTA